MIFRVFAPNGAFSLEIRERLGGGGGGARGEEAEPEDVIESTEHRVDMRRS